MTDYILKTMKIGDGTTVPPIVVSPKVRIRVTAIIELDPMDLDEGAYDSKSITLEQRLAEEVANAKEDPESYAGMMADRWEVTGEVLS